MWRHKYGYCLPLLVSLDDFQGKDGVFLTTYRVDHFDLSISVNLIPFLHFLTICWHRGRFN